MLVVKHLQMFGHVVNSMHLIVPTVISHSFTRLDVNFKRCNNCYFFVGGTIDPNVSDY